MGALGENKFDELCRRADLNVSALIPDMTGKDRLVEFPFLTPTDNLTFDTRSAPLACYVQIKTILISNKTIKMRLSTAELLAKETKPAFICVFRMNLNYDFSDIHLIHFSDSVIKTILARLRKEHARQSGHINRKFIQFDISVGQLIDISPIALKNAFAACIGKNMPAYAARKDREITEVGYGNPRFKFDMELASDGLEALMDAFLGLTSLPVTKFHASELRFGIPLPHPEFNNDTRPIETRLFRIQPNVFDTCDIVFMDFNDVKISSLFGDVFVAAIPTEERQIFKIQIKTAVVDFFLFDGRFKFKTNSGWKKGQSHPLKIWRETLKAWKCLGEGGCKVIIHLNQRERDLMLPPLSKFNDFEDHSWFDRTIKTVEDALEIQRLASAKDDPLELDDLMENSDEIIQSLSLMTETIDPSSLAFKFEEIMADEKIVSDCIFLYISAVIIGNHGYAFALRATMNPYIGISNAEWLTKEIKFLLVEQLSENPIIHYDNFSKKMQRITNIKHLMIRDLISKPSSDQIKAN